MEKNTPARDPKTGRFVSTNSSTAKVSFIKERKSAKAKTVEATAEATAEATSTTATTAAPAKEKKAKAPKAEKPAGPVINILSALYGIEGNRIEVKDNVKVGNKLTNKMAGSDPAPKTKKNLVITATVDGTEVTRTIEEGEKVTLA